MDWTQGIDAYCERLGPGLLAEPLNALTNLAFLLAAAVLARRLRGTGDRLGWALTGILAVIGLGSGLFHTLANAWAALADVLPIAAFVLVYLYAANRAFLGLGRLSSLALTLCFLPCAALAGWLFSLLPFLGSSAGYAPIPPLILGYAYVLRRRAPDTAQGLALGAGLLVLSLAARTLDAPSCAWFPVGTHFLWHLLNAAMLGWMIEVYRRHVLAGDGAGR